ncbi:MmcQ/YjbR family DNA-binding protein [Algoriphagus aestuariicola]|uniref:MmcQ/YjbR family DNA-binding protein n=1 Tax=Algoriphagus aestuariicola TaxID=1852016 RepID=A0ABS3BKP7_9BACT|nr:MmcQ/YjbR family DNA-binding protein [Algoriphagus aestuariicola]MBN7799399.1 MmcQ/YjbR family DNA-binding protein [Algoriphagus aestuariicola]
MNPSEIRSYCLGLKGVTESIKWDDHLCFSVGDKMFFVLCPDQVPVTGSFKTTPEHFEGLIARSGLTPAPYLARHKWVYYEGLACLSDEEWKASILESYHLVFEKLPTKTKKQIEVL